MIRSEVDADDSLESAAIVDEENPVLTRNTHKKSINTFRERSKTQ